jgi:peptide/nickel transport system substrate-binding protein
MAVLNKLPVVASDLLRKAGFNVDTQSMDMNTFIARRARKEGWNLFPSYGAWSPRSAPISQNSLSAAGYPKAWAGWPKDSALEKLRDAFALADSEEERKAIATRIQVRAMEVGTHVPLGEFRIMTAARKNVKGFLTGNNFMLFWNVEK